MIVFLSDGFVTIKADAPTEMKRFFEIAVKLPLDMQHLLAKNITSSAAIPSDYISLSIKSIFLSFEEDSVATIGDAMIVADLE